ncbi:putative SIR2 superfamily [Rosellinia necatrix]|uniref:Putative SIR2 superfamily n=1 Tax=Rosellinia necatrix TaxID=77044 RepID=A0A1W2TPN7_ROSNE|nr:putative SIR2 superfamily [Rosellinia necatrix]
MPTLQITPDAPDLLQDVADTLARSRKMVIITGAGISTNSGIPDFRSENGLYSLIQDQFERAEANVNGKKDLFDDHDATPVTVSGTTVATLNAGERPLKRRRTSGPGNIAASSSFLSGHSPSQTPVAPEAGTSVQGQSPAGIDPVPALKRQGSTHDRTAAVASLDSSRRVTRSQATALRPTLPRHLTQHSVDSSTSHDSIFSDRPPSCESSQTDTLILAHTPRPLDCDTQTNTPIKPVAQITSSSPLSSPPPDLFDPFENANSSTDTSSHEDSDGSDTSESDDTQQSLDFLSSQASSSNLRNMKGRDLFDCNIWADPLKTSVFYRFATSLRQRVREVEPTVTHRFIAQMRDVGKLARVYTQNIDEIEKKIGLSTDLKHGFGNKKRKSMRQQPPEASKEEVTGSPDDTTALRTADMTQPSPKLEDAPILPRPRPNSGPNRGVECVFLHGSLHSLRCFVCGKLCDWDEDGRELRTLSGEQPECPHCAGATAARQEKGKRALGIGKLRPDIVLYGEEHPQSDLISPIVQHDLAAGPDLLLVLGTSLRVHGLKVMVKEFAKAVHKKGGKVIFINFTKPSESAWGDVLDYWIEWDCDAWVEDLRTRKPLLWLSPTERLELDRLRRETLAEKKKEALKKRESIMEKKREDPEDKGQSLPEQSKKRPPPKNPVAMRNDYHCGAYIVWDIFQALAKIGDRPFDNLGYTPRASSPISTPALSPSSTQKVGNDSELGDDTQTRLKSEKKKRKPRARATPSKEQQAAVQPCPSHPVSGLNIPLDLSNLSSTAVVGTAVWDPKLTHQPTTSPLANEPRVKKKRARKSAPATLVIKPHTDHGKKPASENKRPERHTGKDRYLQAVRELAKSRKTPTPGNLTIPIGVSGTPAHSPPPLKPHGPDPRPIPSPYHFIGQAGIDDGNRRHSTPAYTSYSFQPQLLPPLPDPPSVQYGAPHHPLSIPATPSEPCQGPMLAPLHINWKQSPQSRVYLEPIEIAPLVGPASPLADKRPALNNPHCSYSWHHSTQPIYNDPLVGISRQAITHKPQWHIESNDDNTPSPSDQLRMEAANQLSQLQGET